MKTKQLLLILLYTASLGWAQTNTEPQRSYLGVMLDTQPIPSWLSPQLGLKPGQGIRIRNMHTNGPADKAGLLQNDIIIELNGYPVLDERKFVTSIANAGIGKTVTLTILRQGRRKTIKVTLGPKAEEYQPKYPPEPQEVQSWRSGNVYRFDPNENQWRRITPPTSSSVIASEIHQFRYPTGGEPITVTIIGDPQKDQAHIEIDQGQTTIQTTAKDIKNLPDPMRDCAQRALDQAKKKSENRENALSEPNESPRMTAEEHPSKSWEEYTSKMLEDLKEYAKQLDESAGKPRLMLQDQRQRLDRLEQQVHSILQRLDTLEAQKSANGGQQTETPKP